MNKFLLYILKPFSFLPALLMMYVIYSFSAQTGEVSGSLSYTVSYKIVEIGNDVLETTGPVLAGMPIGLNIRCANLHT